MGLPWWRGGRRGSRPPPPPTTIRPWLGPHKRTTRWNNDKVSAPGLNYCKPFDSAVQVTIVPSSRLRFSLSFQKKNIIIIL
jgi:hypothetical protein